MQINQLLVGAAYGDAITNEAIRLRQLLSRACPSEIFAVHVDSRLTGIRQLEEYRRDPGSKDLLIAYLSIGQDGLFSFLRSRTEQIVLRYHSMTPAEELEQFDPEFAALLAEGRDQVAALASRCVLGIAGSRFAERELAAMGFRRTATCPLLVSADTLLSLPQEAPRGLPATTGPMVLCVGRIVPNKALEDVIAAFHVLKTYHIPDASLVFVGGRQFPVYQAMLDGLLAELGLVDVAFLGKVPAPQLAALYRRSAALVCLSRHEGFCAPLLEAMEFEVPIVAIDSSAVGETLGGAGFLLNERSPTLVAEALYAVIADAGIRSNLIERGRKRARAFEPATVGAQMLAHIAAIV